MLKEKSEHLNCKYYFEQYSILKLTQFTLDLNSLYIIIKADCAQITENLQY